MVAATLHHRSDLSTALRRLGRAALVTQGVLYLIVGVLAARLADGDAQARPSQRGALESLAHGGFARVLLAVLAVGLAGHCLWRLALAARGEPGDDDDGRSIAKRLGNLGRAAIYGSFTWAAVRLLAQAGGSDSSGAPKKASARVLTWPGGRALVVAAGVAVAGAAAWNVRKAITRSFTDRLELGRLDEAQRRAVTVAGTLGYAARGWAFALVGWFLIQAGLHHDPGRTEGLDGSLRRLAATSHGHLLLFALAIGLVLFGAYRACDGLLRRPAELTHA